MKLSSWIPIWIAAFLFGMWIADVVHRKPKAATKPVIVYVPVKQPKLYTQQLSATVYYPTGDPTYDGSTIYVPAIKHLAWCALSRDVLVSTGWRMGDTLLVYGSLPRTMQGFYILHDKTNDRLRRRIDILMPAGSYSDRWDNVQVRKFTLKELTQ